MFSLQKGKKKSRECHNHKQGKRNKPQPFLGTKRKQTKPNKRKSNKCTKSTKISSVFPKQGNLNAKRTEKTQEQNNTRQDFKQIASYNKAQSNKE